MAKMHPCLKSENEKVEDSYLSYHVNLSWIISEIENHLYKGKGKNNLEAH